MPNFSSALRRFGATAAILGLFGCGSPVPSGMSLTMSVSTRDVTVSTSINDEYNDFLSSDSDTMASSMPLNKLIKEGANSASFTLTPSGSGDDYQPAFLASLEISLKGEIVDTQAPGERGIFSRTLSDEEVQSLKAGETVTITENFEIEKTALTAIKDKAGGE
ncbi:hypothetical protein MNBD_GAMMA26-900 [hydrothermal vent metagenome]|uniref:Uncharacterized protein n=1 Tax=hydrothermal vent metagenome TaxID=652676 RepID=A0A3B1BIT0_9ZZZZ